MEIKTYYKRLEVLGTNLKNKYRQDIFFRTQCNVIFFQIFFAFSLLLIVTISFNHLYQNVTGTLVDSVKQSIVEKNSVQSAQVISSLEDIKRSSFFTVSTLMFIITILFGYFGARIALTPTKNALASQKRFISNIAHELRSPLAIIKTNSEVALMNDSIDAMTAQSLKSNIEELNRTSDIIYNLLSLTTLVRPGRLPFSDVDFSNVIDNAVKQMKSFAKSKGLEIIVHKKKPSIVWGNSTALEQVVVNLTKNAITHTPRNGTIEVSVEPDYIGNVILQVKDNGSGIAQKDLFHIFEPFYKAESSRTRRTDGVSSGLGLTIVSEMVKIHGGKISIKSSVGKGTCVSIVFPFSKNANSSPQSSDDLDETSVEFLS